jgi:hypothetical protein
MSRHDRRAEAARERNRRAFSRKFYAGTAEHIKRSGRSIMQVFVPEGEEGWPFSYTIGNHLRELPELLAIGTSQGGFLNDLSQKMVDAGKPFEDGQFQVGEYFGHQNYSVMQVLIPDREGKFPGEDGCQPPWSQFPVLRPF